MVSREILERDYSHSPFETAAVPPIFDVVHGAQGDPGDKVRDLHETGRVELRPHSSEMTWFANRASMVEHSSSMAIDDERPWFKSRWGLKIIRCDSFGYFTF
jgi:hypothetical protein